LGDAPERSRTDRTTIHSDIFNGSGRFDRTITRLDVVLSPGSITVLKSTTIASGYTPQPDAAGVVVGPLGWPMTATETFSTLPPKVTTLSMHSMALGERSQLPAPVHFSDKQCTGRSADCSCSSKCSRASPRSRYGHIYCVASLLRKEGVATSCRSCRSTRKCQ